MLDRAGFLAGLADTLSELCAYYLVAGIFIMARRGWGLHMGWLLLWGTACALIFALFLQKPRTVPVLTTLTGVLGLAGLGLFMLASRTAVGFGYGFVLAVGAGMAVGLPLYYCLHRPALYGHLTHLDGLILVLLVLLLCREPMGLDGATVWLTVGVLFLDAASAVGLRMTGPDGDGSDVMKASMVALGGAVGAGILSGLMAALFSRSGGVTGAVFRAIGRFFAAIGRGLETFLRKIAALLYRPETYDTIVLEGELPSVAEAELQGEELALNINPVAAGIVIALLAVAVAVIVAVALRKKAVRRQGVISAATAVHGVRRKKTERPSLWRRCMDALRFQWTVFQNRNTPAGLLMRLERRGRRCKTPRQTGETMRAFIGRMDPTGGLASLADALDREYYGGQGRTMPPRTCRALGKRIRNLPSAAKQGDTP